MEGCKRDILIKRGNYALSGIMEQDRSLYVELQKQLNGEATLFSNPYIKDLMWESTISDKGLFVILDEHNDFCGTVEIKDDSNTPEIGISILELYQNKGIAKIAVGMLMDLTYNADSIDYYVVKIKADNTHSRHVFEKMGAEYMCEIPSSLDSFMESLNKYSWNEEEKKEISELYLHFEEDSAVVQYKMDPKKIL